MEKLHTNKEYALFSFMIILSWWIQSRNINTVPGFCHGAALNLKGGDGKDSDQL